MLIRARTPVDAHHFGYSDYCADSRVGKILLLEKLVTRSKLTKASKWKNDCCESESIPVVRTKSSPDCIVGEVLL